VKTVFVGLSGGVDSATAAYLLKKEGYRVVGAFIKGWEPDFLPCTGKEDRQEAMRVAAHLGIPFVTYDCEEEYKKEVVDYFIDEYKAGRTPNPDVVCNRAIKFGAFWEKAKTDGADYIATGHYAVNQVSGSSFQLSASRDKEKDQTYFLWTLTQADLTHTLFPVGGNKKNEIREIASRARLPNARRRDSQGLCFLGHVDMHAFLKRYIPEKTGDMLDGRGQKIGEHYGVWFYTLGQHVPLSTGKRMYVVGKDTVNNQLTVSETPLGEHPRSTYAMHSINWVNGKPPHEKILARYRYRQLLLPAHLKDDVVTFSEPQLIAGGQSCVFYSNDGVVLGGGVAKT
jgi:tRNA-uridine 2-sulfurtransferase